LAEPYFDGEEHVDPTVAGNHREPPNTVLLVVTDVVKISGDGFEFILVTGVGRYLIKKMIGIKVEHNVKAPIKVLSVPTAAEDTGN
jgi:hypothetical protein